MTDTHPHQAQDAAPLPPRSEADIAQPADAGPVARGQAKRAPAQPHSAAPGTTGVFREITTVEDEIFHLAEHTIVDALHLTGRVATVAVTETTHVLGSAVRGIMHILTRTLPKGSDLRQTYTMAEAAEEILPEVERILPLL